MSRLIMLVIPSCLGAIISRSSRTKDYLMMQHLRGRTLDKSRLVAEPDYQEMLDRLYEINGL